MRFSKLFIFGAILISLIIFSQLTNAWWFSREEPQLSSVQPTVTITNTPPFAVSFPPPTSPPFPSTYLSPYIPVAGTSNGIFVVAAVFQDNDGQTDLPGSSSSPTPLTYGGNIFGGIQSPAGSIVGSSIIAPYTICSAFDCSVWTQPTPVCNNPSTQIIYVCVGALPYYYPAGTWSAGIQVRDNTNNLGPLGASTIQIGSITGYTVTGAINWPSLSLSATNVPASQQIVMTNVGNTNPSTTTVTGGNLIGIIAGTPNPAITMSINAFSMSSTSGGSPIPAECNVAGGTATQLTTNPIPITGALPTYTGTPTGNAASLNVCIAHDSTPINSPGILSPGQTASQYTTPAASPWDVTIT